MYLGLMLQVLGMGILMNSITVYGYGLLLFGAINLFVILYEEPDLERRFGQTYTEYRSVVHRWVPRWSYSREKE